MTPLDYEAIWPIVQVVMAPLWPYVIILAGVTGGIITFGLLLSTLRRA